MWTVPVEPFEDEWLMTRSAGDWLACDLCAHLIRSNQWTKLARRALLTPLAKAAVADLGEDGALAEVAQSHKILRQHMRGAPYRHRKVS